MRSNGRDKGIANRSKTVRERPTYYDEDKEYNPYYTNIKTGEETNQSYSIDNSDLSEYDLEFREGESIRDRKRRLKVARQAQKQSIRQKTRKEDSSVLELSVGRVFRIVLMVGLWGFIIFVGVLNVYNSEIRFPSEMPIQVETTGLYCINNWVELLNGIDEKKISEYLGKESYLEKEINYANGNKSKKEFFKKMLSTVSYTPYRKVAKNKYGNDLVDEEGKIVYADSYVELDEKVKLSYVDYDAVEVDEKKVKAMLAEEELTLGDAGYSSKLATVFCNYILDIKDLPIKEEDYIPNLEVNPEGIRYVMTDGEDVELDRLLFSSKSFHNLLERFSEIAAKDCINPEWTVWDLAGRIGAEPIKIFNELPKTEEWLVWNTSEAKGSKPEPRKYNKEYVIGDTWCGSYYLQNEYKELDKDGNEVYRVVEPSLGDGSFENPASLNTEVVTKVKNVYRTSDGSTITVDCPIGVTMIEYGVSKDALDWFDSKDERNRGHDIKSEVQYAYYRFRIRNLSSRTVMVSDNSSLCDSNVNFSERTGIIYGINDKVTLKPGEEGIIESWSESTELNLKYIVWGKTFSRESDVVWFRKLAGDLEDTSVNKGVSLNTTRMDAVAEVQETEIY